MKNNKKRGILWKTKVYLGGNLENCSDVHDWRKQVSKELSKMGIISLDPTEPLFLNQVHETDADRERLKVQREEEKFDELYDYMRQIVRKDARCIDLVDWTIFCLEVEKPTFGTIHEMVLSLQQRKPILLLLKNRKKMPLWFSGLIPKKYLFETIEELIEYVKGINEQKIKINDKFWKLLNFKYR